MKKTFLLFFLTLLLLFLFPLQAYTICEEFKEGGIVPCGGAGEPCEFCHIFVLLNNILMFILTCLAPIIAGLMTVIAGVMFMISYFSEAEILPGGTKGGPALFAQARKTFTAVVVGLLIIFLAWVFLNTFLTAMNVASWTGLGSWWDIDCP